MSLVRREVLRGTLDPENPLSLLRGNPLVWQDVFGRVDSWYDAHITNDCVAFKVMSKESQGSRGLVKFPKPQDININMMPFKFFQATETLPMELHAYIPAIMQCPVPRWDIEKECSAYDRIAYLTVHEGWVKVGESQRRPGLHVERPGVVEPGSGGRIIRPKDDEYRSLAWGMGYWRDEIPVDGLYFASTITESTAVWPVQIRNPEEVTDRYGGIEHMREWLGAPTLLQARQLCWLTDTTPHESLPLKAPADDPTATRVYRQLFRIVVGRVSKWYAKHNTPNPLGIEPDAEISHEDKFQI